MADTQSIDTNPLFRDAAESRDSAAPVFSAEPYTEPLIQEMLPLFVDHWREIATHKDIPLKPVWEHYEKISAAGMLRIYTIRYNTHLKGYAVFTVVPNSHYGTSLQANNDIIFLDVALRGKLVGFRFIKYCDQQLKAEGVQRVIHHIKLAHNWGKLLERQGYMAEEIIYSKRLDL